MQTNNTVRRWRDCDACGATMPRALFERQGYHIVECSDCGLVYVGEDPQDIDFSALYDEKYYVSGQVGFFADYLGEAAIRRASARRRVWGLWPLKRRGTLLDVGCAAGFFLVEAASRYRVYGVEFSEFSSRFAREQYGLNVFTGTLHDAAFASGQFDLVTLWDVIEHVPDPASVLTEVARVLAPGGRVVLTTGDIGSTYAASRGVDWHLMTPPWHMYFFSRTTISRLAARVGLRVVRIATRGVAGDGVFARSKPGIVLNQLLGRGDIMQVTLAHAQ